MNEKAYMDASDKMDRIVRDINRVKDRDKQYDVAISEYVQISNSLRVEADDGENEYSYEYLKILEGMLGRYIVIMLVYDKGYYSDTQDEFNRWKKDEGFFLL